MPADDPCILLTALCTLLAALHIPDSPCALPTGASQAHDMVSKMFRPAALHEAPRAAFEVAGSAAPLLLLSLLAPTAYPLTTHHLRMRVAALVTQVWAGRRR